MVIRIATGINQMKKGKGFDSESFQMDRLSMEQGKMVDKRGSVVT